MNILRDQNAGRSHNVERFKYLGTTQTNENSIYKEIESRLKSGCLLSFGAESFVVQYDIQNYKDQDTQNCNFVCCFVWVRNLVGHIEGGT